MLGDLLISEIEIFPLKPKSGLVGFCSFVIFDSIYIGSIGIHTSPGSPAGFRLVFPTKILPNGKQISCAHPISREVGEAIQKAVVRKIHELTEKVKGHYFDAKNISKFS